jgi:hypothetical protein
LEAARDKHAVFDMCWDVHTSTSRREGIDSSKAKQGRRQANEGHYRHAPAGPMLDLKRVPGVQREINRIDHEGAQEEQYRFKDGPAHQENSFS